MDRTALLVAVILVLGSGAGLATAQSGYEVTVDGAEEVPERTVTIEGDDYRVDAISQVTPGEEIVARVDPPSADASYRLRLYDSEMNVVASDRATGSTATRIASDCQDCQPGTYMVALYEDGVMLEIHPVVIAGYEVDLTLPNTATEGDTVEATIDVTEGELTSPPARVELVLGSRDGEDRRVTATHEGGTTYTAKVDLAGLDPATYTVYAAAMSEERAGKDRDEREALAISQSNSLVIEADEGSNGGTGGGDGGSGPGAPTTPTDTATPTDTEPTPKTPVTDTATPDKTDPATPTDSATPEPTTDDSNVITPNDETATDDDSATEDDGPAPSIPLVVGVCLTIGLWLRRQTT